MNPVLSTLIEGSWPGVLAAGASMALLPWMNRQGWWRVLALGFTIFLTLRYIIWRFLETIPPQAETLNFTIGSIFFAIEASAIIGVLMSLVTLMRTRNRSVEVEANREWLFSRKDMPTVSVFICTYNEEKEILERTIIGAMAMDYPDYDVWVLDDGRRGWLKDLAQEIGCNYLTRPDNNHAKAGNINHALDYIAKHGVPPDFISILDADFVPGKNFLWRTLTLFRDEEVGVVQTPQHFSNPDPIQANLSAAECWPDEQRYFFDVVMASKDAWGTAFCCGTSSVIRYSALHKIGGFPVDSVTEDYLITLRMLRSGYRTVYLNERLSLGLAPEGLQEYVTQRSRWCLGFIQILRSPDGPFALGNGLRPVHRLALIEGFLYWSGSYLIRIAGLVVPILYLLFGIHALDVDVVEGISYFLPYLVAQVALITWLSEGRILPILTDVSQLLASREILTAVGVGLVKPKGHKFQVTAKGGDRSKTIVQWQMMRPFLLLLVLTLAGIVWAFYINENSSLQDSSAIALYWSWYNIIVLLVAIAVLIEKPRQRKNERFKGRENISLSIGGKLQTFDMLDISIGGMRLAGRAPGGTGTSVSALLGNKWLSGHVARQSDSDFAIAFENSLAIRAAMIQKVYSGRYRSGVEHVRASNVARKVLAHLFK